MLVTQLELHLIFLVLSSQTGRAMAIGFTWRGDYKMAQNKNAWI